MRRNPHCSIWRRNWRRSWRRRGAWRPRRRSSCEGGGGAGGQCERCGQDSPAEQDIAKGEKGKTALEEKGWELEEIEGLADNCNQALTDSMCLLPRCKTFVSISSTC